jgi:hypothetical protein
MFQNFIFRGVIRSIFILKISKKIREKILIYNNVQELKNLLKCIHRDRCGDG